MISDSAIEFFRLIHSNSVDVRRPQTVIQHILRHGYITLQDLKNLYNYNPPQRAVRNVHEYGIPLVLYRIRDISGQILAAYKFGNPTDAKSSASKAAGRTLLSRALKQALMDRYGSKGFVYLEMMGESLLQVDRRTPYDQPYENDEEQNEQDTEFYTLSSPYTNGTSAWTCERSENQEQKDSEYRVKFFVEYPKGHTHLAGQQRRVISIIFTGNEVDDYIQLINLSSIESAQQMIKKVILGY